MFTFAVPSIAAQRIAAATILSALAVLAWWQVANDMGARAQEFSPTPLPAELRDLDFSHAEASWSQLTIDPAGNLLIDKMTEPALGEAIDIIRSHGSEAALSRMAFLLKKQLGDVASRQVMELLPKLAAYKEAEQQWWAENAGKTPPPHEELFELQDEFLGRTLAQQMFSEQRRVVALMLETQRIRDDATLTQAEKELALIKLQTPSPTGSAIGE
jgi:hypothetical protein